MLQPVVDLMTLANAGNYAEKRTWFYPLKDQLLRRYGVQDGHDKQIIQKVCFHCKGTVAYIHPCQRCRYEGPCDNCYSVQNDDEMDWERERVGKPCGRCKGTGWFVNKTVWLERWKIRDRVFHIPVDTYKLSLLMPDPINVYEGVIQHPTVNNYKSRRAALMLLWIFNTRQAAKITARMLFDTVIGYWYMWIDTPIRNIYRRFKYGEIPF